MRPFAAIVLVVFSSALCAAHRLRRPLRNLRLHRRRLLRSRILPQASSSSKVTALFATASTAAAAAARRFASQSSFKLRTMKRSSPSSRTVSLRICRRPGICLRRKSPASPLTFAALAMLCLKFSPAIPLAANRSTQRLLRVPYPGRRRLRLRPRTYRRRRAPRLGAPSRDFAESYKNHPGKIPFRGGRHSFRPDHSRHSPQ